MAARVIGSAGAPARHGAAPDPPGCAAEGEQERCRRRVRPPARDAPPAQRREVRDAKAGGDRLVHQKREPRPQAVPHLPVGGDPCGRLRVRGERRLDAGAAARIEPSVHEGVQVVLADGTRIGRGHFTLRGCPVTIVGA
ncbi:hypothetical protein [Methylorubrum salsuginis]|uniref:hypothetical protein n=1 Tax=Methylorubrum salsuginis TaxID=414703 RepID=UPI001FCDF84F|nr:hypothetical protein [Methylorubrum salsuginis]